MNGGGIVAVVKNKKYLKAFKQSGAIGKENAKHLEELGIQENVVVKRLVKFNMLAIFENKYYVTEDFAQTKRFDRI